jgi:hypothetical protein
MKHFDIEDWADLARGQTGLEKSSTMHQHLADGCNRCSQVLHMFQSVASIAERETGYEPPEAAVQTAKSFFALHSPKTLTNRMAEKPKLLFDSLQQPLPVGVRASQRSTRQLLYQAGNFLLDLYLEVKPESNRVLLMGQVLRYGEPPSEAKKVPVVLVKGDKSVANTTTDKFGEFQLEFEPNRNHRLAVVLNEQRAIVVPSSSLKTPLANGRTGKKKRRTRPRGEP